MIYQKFLLSEDVESKIEYLFTLEELFKKANLQNIFTKFFSDKLKEIGLDDIPEKYREYAEKRILTLKNTVRKSEV